MFEEYIDRQGEVVTGIVQQAVIGTLVAFGGMPFSQQG